MQKSFLTLSEVIAATDEHYKKHDRKTSFCDARKELNNDSEYFTLILNQDIGTEEKLNQRLQTLVTDSRADSTPPTKENIKLSLLCLNGHIAKLEHRRSLLAIMIAALALTMPVWAKRDVSESLLLIALTFVCALPFWIVMVNIDKRILVLKRAAEHVKFLNE
jgi:hypothetical protein